MTTEVLAELTWQYYVHGFLSHTAATRLCNQPTPLQAQRRADAYDWGVRDRRNNMAFVACPYDKSVYPLQWAAWRQGWTSEDIRQEKVEFQRVPRYGTG